MLFVDFNQDHSCIACGTNTGFSIWNTKPFEKRICRDLKQPIKIIRPLYKTNVMALVGNGTNEWNEKSVHIWDDSQEKIITTLSYDKPIVSVRITRSMLCVATRCHVYIYNKPFKTEKEGEPHQFVTYDNTYTTIDLNHDPQFEPTVVFLGINRGYIHVSDKGEHPNRIIHAHENDIAALAMSSDGKILATVSTKGTVVRVWNIETGKLDFEFRRGTSVTSVTCLAFSSDNRWLIACSGRGTAHVFDIREKPIQKQQESQDTWVEYVTSMLPVWSFAQCRFPGTEADVRAGMDNEYNVFVVTEQGDYYWFRINPICGGLGSLKLHSKLV